MSLSNQFYLLIHTFLYGAFIGLSFDTVGLLIQHLTSKIFCIFLLIFYWTLQLPLAVLFFHRVNQGEFQSYLLIFVLLGACLYFKFFREKYLLELKMLLKVCHQVYIGLKKVLNVLISKPILFIFRRVFDIMVIPSKFLKREKLGDNQI